MLNTTTKRRLNGRRKDIGSTIVTIKTRTVIGAAAGILFLALQAPAHAKGVDPTIDFGSSLKAEFAAEDAGATYGNKRRKFRQRATTPRKRGIRVRARSRSNFSSTRHRK